MFTITAARAAVLAYAHWPLGISWCGRIATELPGHLAWYTHERHKEMVEAAHVIQEMFEVEERRLAGDASASANGAYSNHGSNSKCENSNAYAFVAKRGSTCYVAFRGSNAPTSWLGLKDWFDNFNRHIESFC